MKNKAIKMGPGAANIKGCLLPYLDLNLSEIEPIIGSVMASKTIAMATAYPAKSGGSPRIWL